MASKRILPSSTMMGMTLLLLVIVTGALAIPRGSNPSKRAKTFDPKLRAFVDTDPTNECITFPETCDNKSSTVLPPNRDDDSLQPWLKNHTVVTTTSSPLEGGALVKSCTCISVFRCKSAYPDNPDFTETPRVQLDVSVAACEDSLDVCCTADDITEAIPDLTKDSSSGTTDTPPIIQTPPPPTKRPNLGPVLMPSENPVQEIPNEQQPLIIPDRPQTNPANTGNSIPTPSSPVFPNPGPSIPVQKVPKRCGLRNEDGVGLRVVHASDGETNFGEFPWMAGIFKQFKRNGVPVNEYFFGGALIAPRVVLTSAHNIRGQSLSKLTVRLGEWDWSTVGESIRHQTFTIDRAISHPEYNAGNQDNDIALLVLDRMVQDRPNIGYICLPEQNRKFVQSKNCVVSGWGRDRESDQSNRRILKAVEPLPILDDNVCRRTLSAQEYNMGSTSVCAGGAGKDACKGDGGSPLVCSDEDPDESAENKVYRMAGVVSWGIGCGQPSIPAVYTNVALFRNWIDGVMDQLGMNKQTYTYRQARLP